MSAPDGIEDKNAFFCSFCHAPACYHRRMLNPFPSLLMFGILAPFIIRVSLGATLLYIAVEHFRSKKEIAEVLSPIMGRSSKWAWMLLCGFEVLAGALLVVGAWTQIASVVVILLALKTFLIKSSLRHLSPLSRSTYALMCMMALSLLLSGAGGFAFDLPL